MDVCSNKIKILFVCGGNICRSPLAEGVCKNILQQQGLQNLFFVDSAATNNYHVGSCPDSRAIQIAAEVGIILHHCARQFKIDDFNNFDYILVMDHLNYDAIITQTKNENYHNKVFLFRTFDALVKGFYDVPDPYYGSVEDFIEVRDISVRAVKGFLNFLRESHKLIV